MKPAGPFCKERFSPLGKISQVSELDMQQALCGIFRAKGMPKHMRLDNGAPFANQRDRLVPTNLALWLVAIGVHPIFNPPRSPQKNGTVECMQRVSSYWVGPSQCADVNQLQQKLNHMADFHLKEFRLRRLGDRTRAEVFPQLLTIPRPFEQALIDPQRIRNYLAHIVIHRVASIKGIVGFACQEWNVGTKHKKEKVTITFNALQDSWEIKDTRGQILKRLPPIDLSLKAIQGLTVMSMNISKDQ